MYVVGCINHLFSVYQVTNSKMVAHSPSEVSWPVFLMDRGVVTHHISCFSSLFRPRHTLDVVRVFRDVQITSLAFIK